MKLKLCCVILLSLLFQIPVYSSSYIVKFKSSYSKRKFEHTIKNYPNLVINNIPVEKSIDYILNKSELILTENTTKYLEQFKLVGILKVVNEVDKFNINELLSKDEIEYWEPNYTISIKENKIKDYLIKEQWYLDAINVYNAWKISMGEGVLIGFIDTGLDFLHKEFKNRLWINPREDINGNGTFEPWSDTVIINGISGDLNGIDDDGNGFVDDLIGYDFVSQVVANFGDYFEPDPIPEDEHGHGTLVAGVLAAGINDTGIVGIAPKAKLVVLRAFDLTGNAEVKDIVSAIIYAGLNRVNVLNLSFGTNFDSRFLYEAIKFANEMGCIIIASAGNDGQIINHYPSDYPEVISVGATTRNGFIGQSSNFGPKVDIFAPGYEILTTSVGNKYKVVAGTSFSSPIVAGVVALMLAKNKQITLDGLKSILKSTQIPLLKDRKSINQGIVDAEAALNFLGSSKVEILSPKENQEIDISRNELLKIELTLFSPYFESYSLDLFINDSFLVKRIKQNIRTQRMIDTASLNVKTLDIGRYSLRLTIALKNGNVFTHSRNFVLYNSDSGLTVQKSNIVSAVYQSRNLPIYVSLSKQPTFCHLKIYRDNRLLAIVSDNLYEKEHFIPLNLKLNEEISNCFIVVEHSTKGNLHYIDTLIFLPKVSFQQKSIYPKFNLLPLSYVFPRAVKFKQFSEIGLLINPYKNLDWSGLEYYSFIDSNFVKTSEYSKPFIPVDIGNSNGNEFDEILCTSFGQSIVFEPKKNTSIFENIIFQSKSDEVLWGAKFFDLDLDGKDEIFCYNDKSILIFKYINNTYTLIYKISPPDTFGLIGTKPNLQIADLDGDGSFEIAFFTTNGFLLIYEFKPQKLSFDLEYQTRLGLDAFSVASCIAKLTLNGKPTLTFIAGVNPLSEQFSYEYSTLWRLYRLNCIGANSYEIVEELSFWGSRIGATPQGLFYRNGIASGNLTGDFGEELLISLFPNFYILKYNEEKNSFNVVLWLPFVYSNSVVVSDYDKNDKNEFGLVQWDGLQFYELSPEKYLEIPTNVDGWIDLNDSIYLKWDKVLNANKYQIFELDMVTGVLNFVAATEKDELVLNRNFTFGERRFVIRAIDTTGNFSPGGFSDNVFIFETNRASAVNTLALSRDKIQVCYNGKLSLNNISLDKVKLLNEFSDIIPTTTILPANDTSFIITTDKFLENGRYTIVLEKFRDYWGNYTTFDTLNFNVDFSDSNDSVLVYESYSFIDRYQLKIDFPVPLDTISALNISNYLLVPFGNVVNVFLISSNAILVNISTTPNIYSLGREFFLVLGKIYSQDSTRYVQPPYNAISIARETNDLENAFVYPNPLNLNLSTELTFANIPKNAKIEIYNQQLFKIFEVENNKWFGGIKFDLINIGNDFSPGIYYFKVLLKENGNWKSSELKKFAIIK